MRLRAWWCVEDGLCGKWLFCGVRHWGGRGILYVVVLFAGAFVCGRAV